jgi:hypothetical protein
MTDPDEAGGNEEGLNAKLDQIESQIDKLSQQVDQWTDDLTVEGMMAAYDAANPPEPVRLTYPEYIVITVAHTIYLPEGPLPAGTQGTIVNSPAPHQAEIYLVEFPEPWCVVTLTREDIVLSEDDELCRLAVEEFANGTYEQREQMIAMVHQLHVELRVDQIAELGEEMVDLMSKLPEVMYDDMGPEGQRIVDGGMTVAGQFPRGLSKADLTAWIIQWLIAR